MGIGHYAHPLFVVVGKGVWVGWVWVWVNGEASTQNPHLCPRFGRLETVDVSIREAANTVKKGDSVVVMLGMEGDAGVVYEMSEIFK